MLAQLILIASVACGGLGSSCSEPNPCDGDLDCVVGFCVELPSSIVNQLPTQVVGIASAALASITPQVNSALAKASITIPAIPTATPSAKALNGAMVPAGAVGLAVLLLL